MAYRLVLSHFEPCIYNFCTDNIYNDNRTSAVRVKSRSTQHTCVYSRCLNAVATIAATTRRLNSCAAGGRSRLLLKPHSAGQSRFPRELNLRLSSARSARISRCPRRRRLTLIPQPPRGGGAGASVARSVVDGTAHPPCLDFTGRSPGGLLIRDQSAAPTRDVRPYVTIYRGLTGATI